MSQDIKLIRKFLAESITNMAVSVITESDNADLYILTEEILNERGSSANMGQYKEAEAIEKLASMIALPKDKKKAIQVVIRDMKELFKQNLKRDNLIELLQNKDKQKRFEELIKSIIKSLDKSFGDDSSLFNKNDLDKLADNTIYALRVMGNAYTDYLNARKIVKEKYKQVLSIPNELMTSMNSGFVDYMKSELSKHPDIKNQLYQNPELNDIQSRELLQKIGVKDIKPDTSTIKTRTKKPVEPIEPTKPDKLN